MKLNTLNVSLYKKAKRYGRGIGSGKGKTAGVAPKKQIVEVNETMSRWQMLAGITKY